MNELETVRYIERALDRHPRWAQDARVLVRLRAAQKLLLMAHAARQSINYLIENETIASFVEHWDAAMKNVNATVPEPVGADAEAIARAIYLLKEVVPSFIESNRLDGYTVFYDEAQCDGYCLVEDCEAASKDLARFAEHKSIGL